MKRILLKIDQQYSMLSVNPGICTKIIKTIERIHSCETMLLTIITKCQLHCEYYIYLLPKASLLMLAPPVTVTMLSKWDKFFRLMKDNLTPNMDSFETLSRMESLQTNITKMRQPLRRLIHPMILRTNSVVVRHSVFL